MPSEKSLLIIMTILGVMMPIFALGLSIISEIFLILGLYCGISVALCLILFFDLREGKNPKLILVGGAMMFFAFVLMSEANHFIDAGVGISGLYAAFGLLILIKGIKDWIKRKRNESPKAKKMNKKICTGIGMLIGGYLSIMLFFKLTPFFLMIGTAISLSGLFILFQGIKEKKEAPRNTYSKNVKYGVERQQNMISQKGTVVCARCKKNIPEAKAVWHGNHRFCEDCAKPIGLETVPKRMGMQDTSAPNIPPQYICFICKKQLSDTEMIFADGNYYCRDCYSFISDNGKNEVNIDELMQISYEISGVTDQSLFSRIIEVADRLIYGNFVFCKASIGGGVKDITDNGVVLYDAVYTNYEQFKSNMEKDFNNKQQDVKWHRGRDGSLKYSYICAFLARKTLKVYVLAEEDHIVLRWIDTSDKNFRTTKLFSESINEEVYGNNCKLNQIDNMDLNKAFLSNWR